MNSKIRITFSVVAVAAAIGLFASGPLVTNQQAQAFPIGGFSFHHFGFFHHPFFFHHHFY